MTVDDRNDEAAAWAIRLDHADPGDPDIAPALDAWLRADPDRSGALLRAQATLAYMDQALAQGATEATAVIVRPNRRRVLLWTGSGGAALAAGVAGVLFLQPDSERFSTAIGEVRRIPLADGSVAALNTVSRVKVGMTDRVRRVALEQGEAWFQVAHDATRPFVVESGNIRVRAVGTAFSVRRRDTGTEVLVTEGVVETWMAGSPAAPVRIAAGHGHVLAERGAAAFVSPAFAATGNDAIERALAWRSGELAMGGETLAYAVTEINRYNVVQIRVDAALGRQTLVGYFRTNDPVGFAQAAAVMTGGRTIMSGNLISIVPKLP